MCAYIKPELNTIINDADIMALNKFSHTRLEFSHVVQMFRNITKKYFISKFVLSVSNRHENLGGYAQIWEQFDVKCQISSHASSPY